MNSGLVIAERTMRRIDREAFGRSGGDVALWYHHSALLEGEWAILRQGPKAVRMWALAKRVPQYRAAEESVIGGWRKFVENTLGILARLVATRTHVQPTARIRERTLYLPHPQQADNYAINQAIILGACRRAKNDQEVARLLVERADSIRTFAAQGNVDFFRSFGRLLSPLPSSSLRRFEYAQFVLSHWLTSYLWLMPERTASDLTARLLGKNPATAKEGDKELFHFKEVKRDYKLRPHRPSLVNCDSNGNVVLTDQGRSLFGTLGPAR